MWIVGVLPIARGAPHRELSYFCAGRVAEGSLVRVKLRGKSAYGLVIRTESLAQEKQDVKKSSFALGKLLEKDAGSPLSRAFLRTAFEAASYHAASVGAVLERLVPAAVLKRASRLPPAKESAEKGGHHEVLYFSAPREDRIAEYRALARESLARGSSLLIIVPTVFEAATLARDVGRGIEERAALVHGGLSEKKFADTWESALTSTHALLIVGTPLALSLPRADIGAIIVERETSRAYEEDLRPFLSIKRVAELFARNLGVRLILAATTPSVETCVRDMRHEVHEHGLPKRRLAGVAPQVLDVKARAKTKQFDPLLPQSYEALDASVKSGVPVLILAARRGTAPVTVCDDCASVLSCARCASPLVLHRGDASRFLCHFCGTEESASTRCRTCGGWRLTALGIGVERIADTLAKTRAPLRVALASHDRLKTRDAPKLAEALRAGGIDALVSTEFMVPYLPDESVNIIVASLDSFMSVPEYRMAERLFTLLAELRTKARSFYIIQTRSPEHSAVRACVDGSLLRFMRDEGAERERFGYPPAVTLVRIAVSGKNAKADAERIAHALKEKHEPLVHEGRRSDARRAYVIVRVRGAWPDPALVRFLRSLPPAVEVRINPPSLSLD